MAALLFFLWQVGATAFLVIPPRLAMFWLTAVAVMFLWCHAAPQGWTTARARATARVRPVPRGAWPWLAVLAPVMSAGALAMWMLLTSLHLAHDRPLPRQILEYGDRPGGTLVLVMLIAGLAPLTEEFAFRGWIQRPLERRFGPAWAIGVTAVLFALAHFDPGGVPIRVIGGVALGYTAWVTRSIWAGMLLHFAWNVGVLAFGGTFPDFEPATHPRVALPAALVLALSAAVFARAAARLRRASRRVPDLHLLSPALPRHPDDA
ncbi:type II CAAX endopeptidase family protein [Longimicrobium sp.]|uniref:CPBP family intramembrane glutamic endopeptidase n=1 Tax=Longimicrobium sp. TaxID=2029185 RepID=UPI002CB155D3|nr:type II CAAX endopeptidase family protein [Longimicrobium sp.]HSU16811.1 type II CAAX endopeptidase family protein [Longimicrobium sp.]